MAADDGMATSGAGGRAAVWTHRDAMPTARPLPGVMLRLLAGERVMMAWVTLDPGAVVPPHAHANEQLGVVLEGEIAMTIGGETRQLAPGDAYAIPPEVTHHGVAGDAGCLVLDVFAPPRSDYLAMAEGTLSV